jgi:hypothetical protein
MQRVLRDVLLVEDAGHPGQRRESAGPFEQRRGRARVRNRILEVDVPVHAAAKRLVLGVAAAAQGVVLERGSLGALQEFTLLVSQPDPSGDPVGPVLGDLDRRLATVLPIDLVPGFNTVDTKAEGAGGTVADGTDDVVHPPAARGHECTFGVKDRV